LEQYSLEGHALFAGVEPDLLAATARAAQGLTVAKGETIYSPQRFRRSLGILLQGRVEVRRESLLVGALSAGDLFGAAALFGRGEDYPTTLTARSDCALVLIPQEEVRRLLRTSGAFAENYVTYLSGRIQFLSARLDAVSADRAEEKLLRYLRSAQDPAGRVTISATQLSQRLGVGRATLYRAFQTLEESGAIAREGRTIYVLERKM
jgi:CRP-like cAMP-binding protein